MKKTIIASLFYFLSTVFAWSQGEGLPLEFERQFIHKEEKILVKSEKVDVVNILVQVSRGKKVVFRRERATMGEGLQRIRFASPLLFLFWAAGVHGEALTVLNVEKGNIIWEKSSSWPINFTLHENRVEINYTGRRLATDKYEEFSKIFSLR